MDWPDGDVRVRNDGVPEVYYRGNFYPICGHHFWDATSKGADTICKAVFGREGGFAVETKARYSTSAMPVGNCAQGAKLTDCLYKGVNAWGNLNYDNRRCTPGNDIGVKVACPAFVRKTTCLDTTGHDTHIKNVVTGTLDTCVRECVLTGGCKYVGYQKSDGRCALYRSCKFADPKYPGYNTYQVN